MDRAPGCGNLFSKSEATGNICVSSCDAYSVQKYSYLSIGKMNTWEGFLGGYCVGDV